MKLQATSYKGKTAVLSQDLFADDTLQVFDKVTGNYIGLIAIGGNVEELINNQPQEFVKIVEAAQNKNQFSLF